jgi:fumarate reductase subunit D
MGVLHWIVAGAAIFTVTAIFTPFMIVIADNLSPIVINASISMGDTRVQTPVENITNLFIIAPIVMIIVIILWALFASERTEFDTTRDRFPV